VGDLVPGQDVACAGAGYAHHAEVVAVPRNLVAPLPAGVELEQAAFATLGAIAMQGLRRAEVQFGETVVVLGLGLLGLLAVQIARAAGYGVIGLDIDERRVALARELGADEAFDSSLEDMPAHVLALTNGMGADAVVIFAATSSSDPVNLAFDLCRQRGRVVAVGAFGMELDRERMYRKELDFVMSTSYGPGRYDPLYEVEGVDYPVGQVRWTENRNMQAFLRLLAAGQVDVGPLISARYPIERAIEAYAMLESDARPLALLLEYPPVVESLFTSRSPPAQGSASWQPLPADQRIGVAVIGAGSFARGAHLPALRAQSDDYHIAAVVTAHGDTAAAAAQQYGHPIITTDHREVLGLPGVHLALIGTRHHLHAPMVLDALAAGLPVFCEKPLCLTWEELEEISAAVAASCLPVWVGFNRRYSPLAAKLKRTLDGLPRPALITYHVNAGPLAADHWLRDAAIGGGRPVGEGCHFLDFFHYLLDRPGAPATPVRISAQTMPAGEGSMAGDNWMAAVRFDDGSLATLIYSALGHADVPKERVEVHAAGASLVLDDFCSLVGHGVTVVDGGRGNKVRLSRQDKGLSGQWKEIARAMRGQPSQAIAFDAVRRSMALTFHVEEALRGVG
jgi:predicted dehydrogenase/threonine dehydrogenase-like Zn-dependent dehydrogenase